MDDDELLHSLLRREDLKCEPNIIDVDICPICEGTNKVHCDKNGVIICTDCGCVIDSIIDDTPEWRQYEDDNAEPMRCLMPHNHLLPQSSLGTSIGGYGRNRYKTLHKWNYMPYKERSFNEILKYIHKICVAGGIEKHIEDDARILCKQVIQGTYFDVNSKTEKMTIIRGNHRIGIISASVFFACRRNNKSRSPREIARLAGVYDTDVTTGCKDFEEMAKSKNIKLDLGSSSAEHFIHRYCLDLKIGQPFINNTIKIAKNIKLLNIASEHNPISIATACIILQSQIDNININKKHIKETVDISEVTINKTVKKLEEWQRIICSDANTQKVLAEMHRRKLLKEETKKEQDKTAAEAESEAESETIDKKEKREKKEVISLELHDRIIHIQKNMDQLSKEINDVKKLLEN